MNQAWRKTRPDRSRTLSPRLTFQSRWCVGKRIRRITKETSKLLQSYDWPRNIRELAHHTDVEDRKTEAGVTTVRFRRRQWPAAAAGKVSL